jgi:hypothetical protein
MADVNMADKFECDSCKKIFDPDQKRGHVELKAIGWDSLPHANFSARLDLCKGCFDKYQAMFIQITPSLKPFRG